MNFPLTDASPSKYNHIHGFHNHEMSYFLCACLSVTFVHCAQTAEDIDTISFAYDSAVTLPDRIKMGLSSVNPSSPNSQIWLPVFSRPAGYKYSMLAHYWAVDTTTHQDSRCVSTVDGDETNDHCADTRRDLTELWHRLVVFACTHELLSCSNRYIIAQYTMQASFKGVALQLLLSWHHYA